MEMRQLTYFLTAAQTQNFSRAAELCNVAQSALSYQIAALETELGVELFKRDKKRVFLTTAGHDFAKFVRQGLNQFQEGQRIIADAASGLRGTVNMGCPAALATYFLPSVFSSFNRLYPDIRIHVTVLGSFQLTKMVEAGELDFAMLGLFFDASTRSELVTLRELFRQPFRVLAPIGHPLTELDPAKITLERVARERLVVLTAASGIRRFADQLFALRSLELNPVAEINSIEAVKEFVRQGVGISLAPELVIKPDGSETDLVTLPLADVTEELVFGLAYRLTDTLSPAARSLIDALERAVTF